MKLSCNILKKHIKNSEDIDFLKIWDKFTIRTAEVEGVEVKGKDIDGVVTAKILEVADHPKSTKLHILKVDDGKEIKQIVCGAPNVKVGLISALIEVGGHLGDIEIGVRPLVGVDSYGMMCSAKELGISDDHTGIIELPEDTPVGINIKELMPIDDIIVEIDNKSLTHRPDLWGHYGIAREIAAITNHELLPLDLYTENPDVKDLDIKINNPELCYRYIGTKMENITNNVTPLWMQVFLYYAGMRSINLLVDLTNYIMLELGQPLHFYDADRLGNCLQVRMAENGEKLTTLDDTERTLDENDIVISNGEKAIGKKVGNYITIDINNLKIAGQEQIQKASDTLTKELKELLKKHIGEQEPILVVGLGNLYVTPDALGPKVVQDIDITRHILQYMPEVLDKDTRPVSAISPGVLGTTGIETLEILKGIVDNIKPKLLLIIDALASRSIERISSTVQLADTGIVPGAGVGNTRKELTEETLGVPVIAIGIPTVVEAATIAADSLDLFIQKIQEQAKSNDFLNKLQEEDKYEMIKEVLAPNDYNFIVTPKEIDELIENMKDIVARGINFATQK